MLPLHLRYSDVPTPTQSPHPGSSLRVQNAHQVPGSWFPDASAFPLSSLDENANLGTVMRYEEIGEWGWASGNIWGHLPPPRAKWGRGEPCQPWVVFAAGSALRGIIDCSQAKIIFLVISPLTSPY